MWQSIANKKELSANIVIVDLLGFGASRAPHWAQYSAYTQARAVAHTLVLRGITRPVTVVGHSMGALVGIELATRYPKRVKNMILCSPPLYRQDATSQTLPGAESLLRKLYQTAHSNPTRFAKLTTFATKYKLVNAGFNVTSQNITTYMAALEGMILNQTSFDDALQLKIPTYIIRGSLDPFVITRHLKKLEQENPNISVTTVAAGHEIRGLLLKAVSQKLTTILTRSN